MDRYSVRERGTGWQRTVALAGTRRTTHRQRPSGDRPQACRSAGIEGRVNLHRFRHSFSHQWLAAGGEGEDLMMLNGWKSRTMLQRYGSSARSNEH